MNGVSSKPGAVHRFPFTFGNVSLWERREDMMAFARSPEHRDAVAWLLRPGVADGAFIRFLQAQPEGHPRHLADGARSQRDVEDSSTALLRRCTSWPK